MITKVNIQQLPDGTAQSTSPVIFGIGTELFKTTVAQILGLDDPNVRPRLVEVNEIATDGTFVSSINLTIAKGEIVFIAVPFLENNQLSRKVFAVPLSTGVYSPLGNTITASQLILVSVEPLDSTNFGNTTTYTVADLAEINTAVPAFNFADPTILYFVVLGGDLFQFIGANGLYGDGQLQMQMSDLVPISVSLTPTLQEVTEQGAETNVLVNFEAGIDTNHITFDTTPTAVPETQGTLSWSEDDKALKVVLNGYKQIIGGDTFYPVTNQTGASIPKGTAVRFAGTLGASGRLLITKYVADGSGSSSFFMGVTAETIADGAEGKVLWFGRIRGINTSAFNAGDILYASTTTAGAFQTAIPQAPNNIVQVAAVINSHAQQGVIFVRPTIGSNINKDEGVKIGNPQDKQVLQYDETAGLWRNGVDLNLAVFTIELIHNFTVDFYAPDNLKIKNFDVISGVGTVTIELNNSSYTLDDLIQRGDKITVTVDSDSVVNLNVRYE